MYFLLIFFSKNLYDFLRISFLCPVYSHLDSASKEHARNLVSYYLKISARAEREPDTHLAFLVAFSLRYQCILLLLEPTLSPPSDCNYRLNVGPRSAAILPSLHSPSIPTHKSSETSFYS